MSEDRLLPSSEPISDVDYIRDCLEFQIVNHPEDFDTEYFFSRVLYSYYDVMYRGLDRNAGHIIFRLSDLVDSQERKNIAIYPSSDGSINLPMDGDEPNKWDSLEDWRRWWIMGHPDGIPSLSALWPEGPKFLPFFQKPQE